MASYHCEKCGRVFELTENKGGVCPVCATPVSATEARSAERITDPAQQETVYQQALNMKNRAVAFGEWETAGKLFDRIAGYRDADTLATECRELADKASREAIYQQAKSRQGGTAEALRGKAELMRSIAGYRDADTLAETYQRLADELAEEAARSEKVKEERDQAVTQAVRQRDRRNRKVTLMCVAAGAVVVAVVLVISLFVVPANQYSEAMEKYTAGDYIGASQLFAGITYYKDSTDYLQKAYYHLGQESMLHQDYIAAEDYLDKAGGIEDSQTQLLQVRGILYDKALQELAAGEFAAAQIDFDAVGNFEDAKKYEHFCRALRVWNGDETADAEKLDLAKAEDIIWQVMDGVWYSEESEKEITIQSATRTSDTPDLIISNNVLQWKADGVIYVVKMLSKTTFTLTAADGEYTGFYEKA